MLEAWWMAHKLEFVISGVALAVAGLLILIIWLLSRKGGQKK